MGNTASKKEDLAKCASSRQSSIKRETDTLEKAKIARESLGFFESEVSYGGEADLHQHLKQCDKNPGHLNFIPIKEFTVENLPQHCQDDLIVDLIHAHAELTCRLSVRYTSEIRPQFFPGTTKPFPFYDWRGEDMMRTGSGWVSNVKKYKEAGNKPCECRDCSAGITPIVKEWGEILITTAAHVVYDQHESAHTECDFFYDYSDNKKNKVITLRGLDVHWCRCERDVCVMKYVTHDSEVLNKFDKMVRDLHDIAQKLRHRYKDYKNYSQKSVRMEQDKDTMNNLCICVSHPHGCSKQVSVGMWTQRHEVGKVNIVYKGEVVEAVRTHFTYNTPTCRGSSGAMMLSPIQTVTVTQKGGFYYPLVYHPHSEGHPGNKNYSSMRYRPV